METSEDLSLDAPVQRGGTALPVLLLSAGILAQELLLVRLLAVGLWHHITYMVVTSALLAFALAGTLLAIFPRLGGKPGDGRTAVGIHCLLFAITTFVSGYAISKAAIDTTDIFPQEELKLLDLFAGPAASLFQLYLLVGLPILFGGLAVASAMRNARQKLARTYFANLFGSAVGCAAFLLLLTPLGGPRLMLASALLGALAALVASLGRAKVLTIASALVMLACVAGMVSDDLRELMVPAIKPVPSKVMSEYLRGDSDNGNKHVVETTIWDPLCRVDVTQRITPDEKPRKVVFQDGDAPTFIEHPDLAPSAETLVPYILKPDLESLLIIGSGGGRELRLAANRGVKRVVGVEINSATVSLLNDTYKEFTGNLVDHPAVDLVNDEGRAFLARTDEKFDYIQMTGVDTYAALNNGAYVNSESYLYTAEAFDEFLSHIEPGGYFSIIRYFFKGQPRETLRLFIMALDAVKRQGKANPAQHVMVMGPIGTWGLLVVCDDPISAEVVARAQAGLKDVPGAGIVHNPLGNTEVNYFSKYVEAWEAGKAAEVIEAYPLDVRPVSDDSPFLYQYWRYSSIWDSLWNDDAKETEAASSVNPGMANMGQIPTGLKVLFSLVLQSTLVGLVLILGPLILFRFRALKVPGTFRCIIYFACLGLGFMLLEIALAQKFALFLGHPTLSLSVVIGGMLLFSGLGAFVSGWLPPRGTALVATLMVAALAGALVYVLPMLTETWLAEEELMRIGMALAVIAPLGFMMGMPMPSGLRVISERGADLIPWAWGVNGVASVVASVLAVVLAQGIGFTGVMFCAGGLYFLAALTRIK